MGPLDLPDLTPRQVGFVEMARALSDRFALRADGYDRTGGFPLENYADLAESGYPALTVPAEFGGAGASLLEFVLAQERLAVGDASTALAAAMHGHIVGSAAEGRSWPAALLERVCRDSVERGAMLNSVASEPELGSPSRGGRPRTGARPVPGGWRLDGRKTWATGGPALAYFLVTAGLADTEEIGRFLVPADSEGVRLEPTWTDALALRSSGSHDVLFEGVFVPEEAVIREGSGTSGQGWFWAAVGATYLGVGRAALDGLVRYARERTPTGLGRPIATLPAVRQAVGRVELTLAPARAVLLEAARAWSEHPERRPGLVPALGAAKSLCTNAAITATDLAVRTAGGAALTRDLPLERFLRDARAGLAHPPADDVALEMVGAARLDAARDG